MQYDERIEQHAIAIIEANINGRMYSLVNFYNETHQRVNWGFTPFSHPNVCENSTIQEHFDYLANPTWEKTYVP